MRAFIGIEFSWEQKNHIMGIQNIIKENSQRGRWKYIDNFHLTLKFLGEVSVQQIENIFSNMKKRMEHIEAFDIETGDIGYFSGDGCYRVIYLELIDINSSLQKVYNIIEECCELSGIPKERRKYTPHITIAQDVVLSSSFDCLKQRFAGMQKQNVPVNSISIINSQQIGNKRVYTAQYSLKLSSSDKDKE